MVKVKNLKVTFFHPDLGIGGAERLVLDIAVALSDQGMEVSFVTNHFDKSHAFEELKGEKYPVKVVGDWLPRSFFGSFQAVCAYFRMMYLALTYVLFLRYDDQPDVYIVDQIPVAVPFLKWTKPKVIYYCHHPDLLASSHEGFLKTLYRKPIDWFEMVGTKRADVILVNSKYTGEVFRRTFPNIAHDLKILYPTISAAYQATVSKAHKKSMHELVHVVDPTSDDIYFLSVNRFHPAKKLELALDALAALKSSLSPEAFKTVRLILAGGFDPNSTINATYFERLVDTCNRLNLGDRVIFLKSPSDQLKAELLIACTCLVYTPVNEHFGIVPLEAMAASKPVLAINSGGPRETVEDNVTGFLCEPNGDSIAECMVKVMDAKVARTLGDQGHKRLKSLFTYDAFSARITDIVTQVVCNRN